jgi:hypothetical protein
MASSRASPDSPEVAVDPVGARRRLWEIHGNPRINGILWDLMVIYCGLMGLQHVV